MPRRRWASIRGGFIAAAVLFPFFDVSAANLRVGLASFPPSRGNPFSNVTTTTTFVLANIYDSLVTADNDGHLVPALAERWEMRNPQTWVFHLRPGVVFSNGETWDAAGAKAVLDALRSDAGAGTTFARDFRRITAVTADAPMTLVIKTEAPNLLLPQHLMFVYFPAPAALARAGRLGLTASPVGTGSFVVERWDSARILLAANAASWRSPKIERLELLALPEATAREQALLSDRVDVMVALNPDQIDAIEAAGHSVRQRRPQRITAMIFDTISQGSPFRDARVRQALNFAVDRDAIARRLLAGRVAPASQPAIATAIGFDPGLEPYPYDPARARALLSAAGYPNGLAFTYEFAPGNLPNDAAVVQQIAADLAGIGVTMEVVTLTFAEYARKVSQGGWRGFAWSMDYPGYFQDALKPFYGSVHSCEWHAPWYCEPQVEARVREAAESTDLDRRVKLTQGLMKYYRDIAQGLFLNPVLGLDGIGPRVQGWAPWGDNLMLHTVEVIKP